MKKVLSIIISVFIIFLAKDIFATSYNYIWENTYIDVTIGDSLYNYINLPKATLCKDGIRTNEEVYYLRGDMLTCEENINTSKLGEYLLAYCAISEIEEYIYVTFNVVDNVAPVIKQVAPLIFSQKPDYSYYFNISDNYSTYKVDYIDDGINYDKPGNYSLTVSATDEYNNNSKEMFDVIIVDCEAPTITVISKLELEVYKTLNPLDYFKAIDAGIDVSNTIVVSEFNNTKLGNQSISVTCHDGYDNYKTDIFVLSVVDKTAPKIELDSNLIRMSIEDINNIKKETLLSHVIKIEDNYDTLRLEDIEIDYNGIRAIPGEYSVFYSITDNSLNELKLEAIISVYCDSVPELNVKNVYVNVGNKVNYYNYISSTDKYDGDITSSVIVDDSSVNLNKEGIYFAQVSVKNSNGKYNYKTITVYVKKSFISKYYWIFFIPLGIIGVVLYFIIRKYYLNKNNYSM